MEYWRVIYNWTRYKGAAYGIGAYATSAANNPKYDRVYFRGDDLEDMLFYITKGSEFSGFSINWRISAYDFGLCRFTNTAVGLGSFLVYCTGSLEVENFVEKPLDVSAFLGDEFINITTPLGESCNVFNNKYHVMSYTNGNTGKAYIREALHDAGKVFEVDNPINGAYYTLGSCVYFKKKIYFLANKTKNAPTIPDMFLPLFYIDNEQEKLLHIEAPLPDYNKFIFSGGVDADNFRMVWSCGTYDSGSLPVRFYVYEYDGNNIEYKEIGNVRRVTAVKLVGKYIVASDVAVSSASYAIYAGKTVNDLSYFWFNASDYDGLNYNAPQRNTVMPRVFYEENGDLLFDIVYTEVEQHNSSYIYAGSSYVIKMRLNFETGKIDEVSRTGINGAWED
ncbi:MAG: hypothetical protein NC489_21475 [Ruminococcus flavefaciens]|nr:hypothetical protein [Ruminococcus flavefaciens]